MPKASKKPAKKTRDDLHFCFRPGERTRFAAGQDTEHADNLTAWVRKTLHDRCDALGIPRR